MAARQRPDLRTALEALAIRYQTAEALEADPLSIPRSYGDPWDRELAAWVAAHLAYGRVAPMLRAIRRILAPLGDSPSGWLRSRKPTAARRDLSAVLEGWVWRFHEAGDMVEWLLAWRHFDGESRSRGLEAFLLPRGGETADQALSRFVQALRVRLPATHGTRFSLPDPLEGSACKRWRMFLRWMARTGWPDLGQWEAYPRQTLVIPLDTHVARVSRLIGLSARRTPDGRMAAEITEALRTIDPEDPLRFDFALSHLGILGDCPGIRQLPGCAPCPLVEVCGRAVIKRKTPTPALP